ncbi:glutamate racemase [Paenibacillus agri]|uniref:Glutamate racemase n=1 Tax=Paenibacillus agri TaxID=2744309 RepID=A0A850ENS0_9BACL|nr:glutamate racemase [Paenibacillus agri]NUU62778.1 glutamate racemase [Paenibacillus agri]
MRIGIFDSGVGGITVLHEALKQLPMEDYIYYADTLHVPYGPKPKEEVRTYISNAVEFIVEQQVKAVVIACNTATSVSIDELRARYDIPIIGMEPAVKPAVEHNRRGNTRVLVTATALTLKEEKLQNLITKLDNEHIVDLLALPGLVHFAEELEFSEEAVLPYLREQLQGYDWSHYETVVLGCTHFSFYKDMFRKLLPEGIHIIDGNRGTVNHLKRTLAEAGDLHKGSGNLVFYQSGVRVEAAAELEKYGRLLKRLDQIQI